MWLATWNVNSIRARLTHLTDWLARAMPHVVCLQETKVTDEDFPREALEALGYHVVFRGQKSYNGVAILSRSPITEVAYGMGDEAFDAQTRVLSCVTAGLRVISIYVPNGATMADPKAEYKLAWFKRLRRYLDETAHIDTPLVMAGDFNIAPRDVDISEPVERWYKTVIAHPTMRAGFAEVLEFGLVDVFAAHRPEGREYSWWDYRTGSYAQGRGGLRIDGLLATPIVAGCVHEVMIDKHERGRERPSDHVPVMMRLER